MEPDIISDIFLVELKALAAAPDAQKAPPTEFRIFPFGKIDTSKGTFNFTPEACDQVIAERERQSAEVQIDYDHLAIESAKPGDGVAAGWCNLEKRGDGLWAVNVRWTPKAAQHLRDGEYRYFSPAFVATKKARLIIDLVNIALTNMPAMRDIDALVAASRRRSPQEPTNNDARKAGRATTKETVTMAKHKLGSYLAKYMKDSGTSLKAMAEKCGIGEERMRALADGEDPTPEEMKALAKGFSLKDDEFSSKLSAFDGEDTERRQSEDEDDPDEVAERRTQAAARRPTRRPAGDDGDASGILTELTGEVDPEKAKAVLQDVISLARRAPAMEKELTSLQKERDTERREALIAKGKREGKLTPALIRIYAKRPLKELEEFLAAAPVLPTEQLHLSETEPSAAAAILTTEEIEVARLTHTPIEKLAAHAKDMKTGRAQELIMQTYLVGADQ